MMAQSVYRDADRLSQTILGRNGGRGGDLTAAPEDGLLWAETMKLSATPRSELETARQQYDRLCELFTLTADADFAAADGILHELQGLSERIAALEAQEGKRPDAAPAPAKEDPPPFRSVAVAAAPARPDRPPPIRPVRRRRRLILRVLSAALVGAVVVAAAYQAVLQVEQERRALLRENLQEQGRLLALALEPELRRDDPSPLWALAGRLERFAAADARITVLFRPRGRADAAGFFFVAAVPTPAPAEVEEQRRDLIGQGLLDIVADTCSGNLPLISRRGDGRAETLISVTPVQSEAGCWVVILSRPLGGLLRGLPGLS